MVSYRKHKETARFKTSFMQDIRNLHKGAYPMALFCLNG